MLSVHLVGIQLEPATGSSVLVLREHDAPHRLLPISVGGAEAASIAFAAQGRVMTRPMAHDVMASLVESFDGHLDAVELVDLREGTFVANLTVSGPTGDLRLDARPSDAIALAVRLSAPLFVSEHVLDEAGEEPESEPDAVLDDSEIDAQVDRFREFLDDLDPGDFGDVPADDDGGDSDPEADIVDAEVVETEPDIDHDEPDD